MINYKNKHYKYIVLIIDSDNNDIYAKNKEQIKKYCFNYQEIMTIFIRNKIMDKEFEFIENENILYSNGEENYKPGILKKTLSSFKWCENNLSYDFILRTNISSLWNYELLLKEHEKLEKNNNYSGTVGKRKRTPFVSGTCILMSKDIVKICLNNVNNYRYDIYDDVSIGILLNKKGILISNNNFKRYNYANCANKIEDINENDINHIHYRIKSEIDRSNDYLFFEKLVKIIYNL